MIEYTEIKYIVSRKVNNTTHPLFESGILEDCREFTKQESTLYGDEAFIIHKVTQTRELIDWIQKEIPETSKFTPRIVPGGELLDYEKEFVDGGNNVRE